MRLCEITGDTEAEVYDKLRTSYTIFVMYSTTPSRTDEFIELYNNYLEKLYQDKQNLEYWILVSEKIANIYNEIKNVL